MAQDDSDLFREAMDGVAPLKQKAIVASNAVSDPTPGQLSRRHNAVTDARAEGDEKALTLAEIDSVDPHAVLAWRQDGVQLGVFDKLRTGAYAVEGRLDLHHKTVAEARIATWEFLVQALDNEWRCILITHGRGERSATPARLKSYVAHWLEHLPLVIALHSALPRHGGTGATYALLRKSRKARERTAEEHGGRGGADADSGAS